jgi:Phage integrase family/HIRAN domain
MIPESSPPICPTCGSGLARRPKTKTKCPHCGAFIYVRSIPKGGRYLVKEADLPALEARRASTPRLRARWDYVPVVGESHRNSDGSDRQQIIRERARPGDPVQLVPEPDNRHDRRAVKVCLATGEQLGYLDRDQARELARILKEFLAHARRSSHGFVFCDQEGKPLYADSTVRRLFAKHLKAAGCSPVRFHDLRHTNASLRIAAGQHPKYIQVQLGHASFKTTMDIYGHLFEEYSPGYGAPIGPLVFADALATGRTEEEAGARNRRQG